MDERIGNDGRMTPIEQIKASHSLVERMILHSGKDEIPWGAHILPQQVGLVPVFADRNGHLWRMESSEKGQKLVRIWHLS